jgi:vacuolar-type H+-ATPase subunit I/STV1
VSGCNVISIAVVCGVAMAIGCVSIECNSLLCCIGFILIEKFCICGVFQEQELRSNSQLEELMMLRDELKKLQSDYESTKSLTLIFQKDLEKAQQERAYAEERMVEAVKRMEEAEQKRKSVQENAKRAAETVEQSRNELAVVERMKLETQQLATERLTTIERSERHCKTLERERADLTEVCMHLRDLLIINVPSFSYKAFDFQFQVATVCLCIVFDLI